MSELKVPTVALMADVTFVDGRSFRGRIFVPAGASHHGGAMRVAEWLNQPLPFFPFLPDESELPVLLGKQQVLVVSVAGTLGGVPASEQAPGSERRVVVECGPRAIEGRLLIQLPANQRRVLDYLNQPEPFLTLRDGDREHFVQKQHVTRVLEVREG